MNENMNIDENVDIGTNMCVKKCKSSIRRSTRTVINVHLIYLNVYCILVLFEISAY